MLRCPLKHHLKFSWSLFLSETGSLLCQSQSVTQIINDLLKPKEQTCALLVLIDQKFFYI